MTCSPTPTATRKCLLLNFHVLIPIWMRIVTSGPASAPPAPLGLSALIVYAYPNELMATTVPVTGAYRRPSFGSTA